MSSILIKLRQFMAGRYGFDRLNGFLLGVSVLFWALSVVFRFCPPHVLHYVFYGVNLCLYALAVYRSLSKKIDVRLLENERYMLFRSRFAPGIEKRLARLKDTEHIYRKCRKCKSTLRLPRVHGKHTTRCPKCGYEFKVRVM